MKLNFNVLSTNYPRRINVSQTALFREIGWDELIGNINFENTCAIRMSVALIKSGVNVPGQMPIKAGPHKGRMIQTMQGKLSKALIAIVGMPEKFAARKAEAGVGLRTGIVSFFELHPELNDRQGHIDIVLPPDGFYRECGNSCHWSSKEIWFWPLK